MYLHVRELSKELEANLGLSSELGLQRGPESAAVGS